MVRQLPIIREIFKGDHNATAAVAAAATRKLKREQISTISGTLNDQLMTANQPLLVD